jgi:hypothetical protein
MCNDGRYTYARYFLLMRMAYASIMVMAKTKSSAAKTRRRPAELDSVYVLKLVLYLVVGTLWLRVANGSGTSQVPIPVGFILGLLFAMHDHFRIDRKIEYAVLLVAMLVGFWTQVGVYITY